MGRAVWGNLNPQRDHALPLTGLAGLAVCVVAGAVVLSGCLFPSFGDVSATAGADADAGAASALSSGDGGAGAKSASSSTSSGGDNGDASTTAAAPVLVACGDTTCDANTSVCCVDPTGQSCQAKTGDNSTCAYALSCDGNDDCTGASGTICCERDAFFSPSTTTCTTSCTNGDRIVCDPKNPQCPSGQKCTDKTMPFGTTLFFRCSF